MGLFSSLFGSGSKSAYDTSGVAAATADSNKLYKDIFDQIVAAGKPYTALGVQGAESLSNQLPQLTNRFTYSDFNADPSYQFLQDESAKAVERSAAARGSLMAPSTSKALQDRSQALASTEYSNAFNRDRAQNASIYDMLTGVTNIGQNQIGQNAAASSGYADSVSNNNIGLQNAILGAYGAKNANTQSSLGNWVNLAASLGGGALAGRK